MSTLEHNMEAGVSPVVVVKAGTLIDGTGAAPRRGVQITIRDGRIVEVGPSGDVPSDALVALPPPFRGPQSSGPI